MQHFKQDFRQSHGTLANVQRCLRLVDFDQVGDSTHSLVFDMLGLFSFREMELPETIDFWLSFLRELGISPSHMTIHPDRPEWRDFYPDREVRFDPDCHWSDGDLGGYSTEFYCDDVEIGNIVQTMGTCIDVGFGLDRLAVQLGDKPRSRIGELSHACISLIGDGIYPDHKGAGFVLKKIIRCLYREGGSLDHPFFEYEKKRQDDLRRKFERLWGRHMDKPASWWLDTHGIVPGDYL